MSAERFTVHHTHHILLSTARLPIGSKEEIAGFGAKENELRKDAIPPRRKGKIKIVNP